jgi:hypothetical protein
LEASYSRQMRGSTLKHMHILHYDIIVPGCP